MADRSRTNETQHTDAGNLSAASALGCRADDTLSNAMTDSSAYESAMAMNPRDQWINPLPFVTPAEPRPVLSECMFASTFLFPSGVDGDIANANANADADADANDNGNGNDDDHARREGGNSSATTSAAATIADEAETERHRIEPCVSSCLRGERWRPAAKKAVRFGVAPRLHPLAGPRASDMTAAEKRAAWYGPADYDGFKHLAARLAGATIARHADGRRFVVTDKPGKDKGRKGRGDPGVAGDGDAGAVAADAGSASRRGLGYHFSRRRKRERAAARAAVVTWQHKLRGGTVAGDDMDVALILAYAAGRLSRRARGEAQWRGEVDFGAAWPERRRASPPPAVVVKAGGGAPAGAGEAAGKRPREEGDRKRKWRRTEGGASAGGEGKRSRGDRGHPKEAPRAPV